MKAHILSVSSNADQMKQRLFVLSGGGARGFAHVGVAQALKEAGIVPAAVSGTSAGAIIGAFLADGFDPQEIREIFIKQIRLTAMVTWNSLRLGLFSLEHMGDFMRKNLRHTHFEKMPMPFFVTATDCLKGTANVFQEGKVIPAVLAACSIPGIFKPVTIGTVPYADGGLINNLPVDPFSDRKNEVIAVHVNPISPYNPKSSIAAVLDRAMHLSLRGNVLRSAEGCELFIEPPPLAAYGLFDAHKLKEIYQHGYDFTRDLMQESGLTPV
jgi:NTE family protein